MNAGEKARELFSEERSAEVVAASFDGEGHIGHVPGFSAFIRIYAVSRRA